jgi:putative inorganic carbon (hco3(-)) transporter
VIAAIELSRARLPAPTQRVLLLAAAGFAIGLPVGLAAAPQSAIYAFGAYLAGVCGAVLGARDRPVLEDNMLRKVLLYGVLPVAAYALVQRLFDPPSWDQAWLDTTDIVSIGANENGKVRVFSTLNSPGALAPLLTLSLLCYLSVRRPRPIVLAGAAIVVMALSLTFVRSAWVALIAGGLAHVIGSRGHSARVVFGSAALLTAVTLALSPVSATANAVVDRFKTITNRSDDASAENRSANVSRSLPSAAVAPLGHGLGTAGEPSRLSDDQALRIPDNGYLSLIYQVGPIGFLLVMTAIGFVMRAAWQGARARAPGQDLRVLVFAMLVALLVQLYAGDSFYGSHGVIFWFLGGQALTTARRLRATSAPVPPSSASA